MNPSTQPQPSGFSGLGIAPDLLSVLARLNYVEPTPIQRQAIPVAMEGKDVVGIAQTGTGKTLAFGIPMIQRLQEVKGKGLVVLPTRELALQVEEALRRMGAGMGLRTVVLIGGAAMGPQLQGIARDPHIIIATPGRLNDHLQQKTVRLDAVKIVVLDEADRMLDMGFLPQINKIFAALPKERQTMLFSATMPPEIMRMATGHMKLPIRIEVAPSGTMSERVTQEIFILQQKEAKTRLVEKLLEQYPGTTLIFTRTKYAAKKLTHLVQSMGHTAAELHSNRSLNQRKEALAGFKAGKYRVLIATDIASRGIDVTGIELVINFDLPTSPEDYVHRIGRTARAGAGGHAISLATPSERSALRDIERLVRKTIPISPVPDLPPSRMMPLPQRGPQYAPRPPRRFGAVPQRPQSSQSPHPPSPHGFGRAGNRPPFGHRPPQGRPFHRRPQSPNDRGRGPSFR